MIDLPAPNDPTEDDDDVMENEYPSYDHSHAILNGHSSETLSVTAVENFPNLLVSGGMDDVALVWNIQTGQVQARIEGFEDSTSIISFSVDGSFIAIGAENGTVMTFNTIDETFSNSRSLLEGPTDSISFLSWHPRGAVLLAGSTDGMAYMWNAAKSKYMNTFIGHEGAINCGSFTADGKFVVTGSADRSVRVWNPVTGEAITRIQTGVSNIGGVFHRDEVRCLAVGPDQTNAGPIIASGGADGQIFLSQRETGQIVSQLPSHPGGVESIAFSPASITPMFIASGGADGHIRVWDVERSIERCDFNHGGVIAKVLWHTSRPLLISASSEGSIGIWNPISATQVAILTGHQGYITDISLMRGNEFVASTSSDKSVRVFDLRPYLNS